MTGAMKLGVQFPMSDEQFEEMQEQARQVDAAVSRDWLASVGVGGDAADELRAVLRRGGS